MLWLLGFRAWDLKGDNMKKLSIVYSKDKTEIKNFKAFSNSEILLMAKALIEMVEKKCQHNQDSALSTRG